MAGLPVSAAEIQAARDRIEAHIVHTPCPRAPAFDDLCPGPLYFKLENLQRTGSFKDRGSLNRMLQLGPEERRRGVVTASAGNHAQAVAYHAQRLGIPCTVVMPETAPLVKVANTEGFGATVRQLGEVLDDSAVEANRLVDEEGMVMIHPFDDPAVIAGQASMGAEILEQVPDVDVIVVPIGGGGMISGIALAVKAVAPHVRIIGVEAEAAPSARASRDAGRIVKITSSRTLADGIATKRIGKNTFPIIEALVDDLVTVSEEEIASAVLQLLERQRTVVEGGGAVGLAALARGAVPVGEGESVVLVLSGGNIDMNMVSRIIDRGLVFDGRLARLRVKVPDRPGSLAGLTRFVASLGANVLETSHRRGFADISVGDVEIVVTLETRGATHVQAMIRRLEDEGITVSEYT
ncbi:MAG: threonine ammonia-lyase [Gemmatimonadetes bacterium]|nr:threonine ammonia-lyase [Gemmatimonadota bacterium]NNK63805.1 threonine ammonia-lyase [Gemmatimonadota bacterium]